MWQSVLKASQAVAWGGLAFDQVATLLTARQCHGVETLCTNSTGVLVAAFPYFCGDERGNLSLYTRGQDYHIVVENRLRQVCETLQKAYPKATFVTGVDSSPLPEVAVATRAGLGLLGRHGLLIVPPYGSYVFLGTILTNAPLDFLPEVMPELCMECNRCQEVCPTGARCGTDFQVERCLSHVTQQKGELSPEMATALVSHPLIWGCDFCQQVCPYNQQAAYTDIEEFSKDTLITLTYEDLQGLTNRTFREAYPQKAFTWRGIAPLRRNLEL